MVIVMAGIQRVHPGVSQLGICMGLGSAIRDCLRN